MVPPPAFLDRRDAGEDGAPDANSSSASATDLAARYSAAGTFRAGSRSALRALDDIDAWTARATAAAARLSGRTPRALIAAFAQEPILSAAMAETLTGASRAAAQRNLAWMEDNGLIHEITGHSRFRLWRAKI